MRKLSPAFTLVELLIVIVVIAILASVSVVSYSGIQARTRDNIRYSTVKDLMQLLEIYKIDNGTYPTNYYASDDVNGCVNSDGWSYSWADSSGTWLNPLVASGTTTKVPVPPANDCSHYIRYTYHWHTAAGCPSYPYNGYIIQVIRAEDTFIPSDTVKGGDWGSWKLCPEANIEWWVDEKTWVFYKDDA